MNTKSLTDSPPINEFSALKKSMLSDDDMDERSSPEHQIKCIMSSQYIQNSKKLHNKTRSDNKGIICVQEFNQYIKEAESEKMQK